MAINPDEFSDIFVESAKYNALPVYQYEDTDFIVESGDLKVLTGTEALKVYIIRMLATPAGSYGILIKTYNQSGEIVSLEADLDYGSDLLIYLAEPLNAVLVNKMKARLSEILKSLEFITVNDIEADVDIASGSINFNIYYVIGTQNQSLTITGSQVVG